MKKRKMLANKETAMRLWASRYGKAQRVRDYAGRMMDRAAYGDRGSQYGWNLDHIFPQSKGGKTADHNLVCCHILTNDEKADKICFTANGRRFQVIKVENHYEIAAVDEGGEIDREPNFYDSAYGVERFLELNESSAQEIFCAEILVVLDGAVSCALFNFAKEVFGDSVVLLLQENLTPEERSVLSIRRYDVRTKESVQDLLDKCVLLNTYLSHYFKPMDYVEAYDIYYNLARFKSGEDYYAHMGAAPSGCLSLEASNGLYISKLVICNTDAQQDLENKGVRGDGQFIEYSYVLTRLAKNLDKEVDGEE